ncbi:MAG TPA: hypothetical protein DD670_04590 [Planctomycetaceae bacterium]|nr:hypothetical protein [Planctomycetaceae bacterium]
MRLGEWQDIWFEFRLGTHYNRFYSVERAVLGCVGSVSVDRLLPEAENEGDQLAVHFGPFPLFRKRIRYDDLLEVKKGRTTLLDGWGIHRNPWSGWI